jgi:eukaryotic-like serine/threonine-protein kinase
MKWGRKRGWGPTRTWEKPLKAVSERLIDVTSSNPELQLDAFPNQLDKALAKGGPDSPKVAEATWRLANLLCTLDRPDDELPLRERHLAACRRNLGPDDLGTVEAEVRLASCLVKLKRVEDADQLLQHSVAIRSAALGGDNPQTILAVSLLANATRKLGRFEETRDLHMKISKWIESQESAKPVDLAAMAMQMGRLMAEWREFDQAAEFYRRAFETRSLALGPDNPDTLISLRWLALATYGCGKVEDARAFAEHLAERSTRTWGTEARESVIAQELLARIIRHG